MAIATFTYPLPKEQFVAGIGTTVATYTYDGPDTMDIALEPGGVFEAGIEYEPGL